MKKENGWLCGGSNLSPQDDSDILSFGGKRLIWVTRLEDGLENSRLRDLAVPKVYNTAAFLPWVSQKIVAEELQIKAFLRLVRSS